MPEPDPKRQILSLLARVGKGLAHSSRLELLEALAQGERSVDALARACGIPMANTSHHLLVLKECGLLASRREGLQVFYRLADDEVPALVATLRRVAERQLAEVERIVRENFRSRDALQPVRREELLKLARGGEAVVIDVRPADEYAAGHIAGAINVPVESLPRWLRQLPKGREVVAYCRGPYCMLAFDAVDKLRRKGYRARRLEDGFPEWQASRLPVDRAR
ncbi:MAG TPA: metalloregulator ArsR/SmtB family transcription factor [Rubrivivax sp.]|jgi:rhodanese-related sulfurtransferase/DNA-binding transcriptional ArsR family regulator|nr:metalloregulator ArsR/SmtB family transcription factor [Rhodoferax sp.]MCL4738293.1 ArsR family transcriptional regulator [Burkholderiaceae bacterium]MCP5290624.1 metalloregulator ArsR/SmtB family transcription factor [Burkholderiaceae bacterium]HMQ71251.1 metalloregulator ArsR/SmtB family transcription factor [Rubrivivax sp.]HMR71491.1 metalloregulator ArsR/SmtB family transcription factor [Rubrivivax sp.]